jgi:hypothetical protein
MCQEDILVWPAHSRHHHKALIVAIAVKRGEKQKLGHQARGLGGSGKPTRKRFFVYEWYAYANGEL